MRKSFAPCLVDTARFERDRRASSYPRLVADGRIGLEEATIDFQAWVCIAEWMERGYCRLIGGWGGEADPPQTVLSWALLEARAAAALRTIDDKLERARAVGDAAPPAAAALAQRRENVWRIHDIMVRQRESIERLDRMVAEVRAQGARQRIGVAA